MSNKQKVLLAQPEPVQVPYLDIPNNYGVSPGMLVKVVPAKANSFARRKINDSIYKHPYDGMSPVGGLSKCVFLYIKTVQYKTEPVGVLVADPEDVKGFQFDVILCDDQLLEINTGRLKRFHK